MVWPVIHFESSESNHLTIGIISLESPIFGMGCIDFENYTADSELRIFCDIFESIILVAIALTLKLSFA